MLAIKWAVSGETQQSCPACSHQGSRAVLSVERPSLAGQGEVELFRCDLCETLFYGGAEPVIGYEGGDFDNYYWQHYVEVGAGIEAMIRPVTALGEKANGDLLDVGCGFGYIVDFWRRSGRGDALGLESARYGLLGAQILGATIIAKYCGECEEIRDRKFSVVYSSEVIEHVRNPSAFLAELKTKVAPTGVLVLTTPSAHAIERSRPEGQILAPLSPGLHYFLLSHGALHTLLRNAGFQHVEVQDVNGRLMAWASNEPLPPIDIDKFCWTEYLSYLRQIANTDNPWVAGGAKYRLFKDCLNTGRRDMAEVAFADLVGHAAENHGIDLYRPNIQPFIKSNDFKELLGVAPAWLGGALFFGGILGRQLDDSNPRNSDMLEAATLMLEHELRVGAQFAGEAFAFAPLARAEYLASQKSICSARQAKTNSNLCIFAHFDRDAQVAPHVLHYLAEIKAADFVIVFVTPCELNANERNKLAPYVEEIVCRDNEGMDFGSWFDGYRLYGDRAHGKLLLLCNDSVIGPLWNLKTVLSKLLSVPADFYGMVASLEHRKHLQSWFLLMTPSVHQSETFKSFMSQDPQDLTKHEVIKKFELKFTSVLEEAGFRCAALYDPSVFPITPHIEFNPTHYIWKRLIRRYRVPFLKIELIRDNPVRISDLGSLPSVLSDAPPVLVNYAMGLHAKRKEKQPPRNFHQFKANLDDRFASKGRSRAQRLSFGTFAAPRKFSRFVKKSLKDAAHLTRGVTKKVVRIRPRHFHPLHITKKIRKIASRAMNRQ